MSRFPHPPIPPLQAAYIRAAGAPPLNLYRVLGNAPDMLDAWLRFAYALRSECTTSRVLRELIILRTAQLHRSSYEWIQHEIMARRAGLPEAKIHALSEWTTSDLFDVRERHALMLTEAMAFCRVTDDLADACAQVFDSGEMIELILTIGFYCMVPRVLDAIAVTTDGEEDAECEHAIRAVDRQLSSANVSTAQGVS